MRFRTLGSGGEAGQSTAEYAVVSALTMIVVVALFGMVTSITNSGDASAVPVAKIVNNAPHQMSVFGVYDVSIH